MLSFTVYLRCRLSGVSSDATTRAPACSADDKTAVVEYKSDLLYGETLEARLDLCCALFDHAHGCQRI